MDIEHYPKETLKKDLKRIIGKHLSLADCQVFFFGSRVAGNFRERSDIDIGIEGSKPIPIETLARIKEEVLELPILYKIDIVDFRSADKDFYNLAKKNIEIIT